MKNVKKKAGSFDGVKGDLFCLGNGCCNGQLTKLCRDCQRKLQIAKQICSHEYWEDPRSIVHL